MSRHASEACAARILAKFAEVLVPPLPQEAEKLRQAGDERTAKVYEFPGKAGQKVYQTCGKEALALAKAHLPPQKLQGLLLTLWLLSTRLGTMLLCGRHALTTSFPFCASFDQLSNSACEACLLSWKTSSIGAFYQVFKALHGLVAFVLFSMHQDGINPIWDAVGYPGPDPNRPKLPSSDKQQSEAVLMKSIVSLHGKETTSQDLQTRLQAAGLQVSNEEPGVLLLCCDAVVVGSGCGGSVAAANLAQAGAKVLVVEKGSYIPASELSTLEKDAYEGMYEKGGLLMATDDASMSIMAGSTVGGGSRINWSVSFRTPDHVRREWASKHGLPRFNTDEYTQSLDAVCQRLGVQTGVTHNKANSKLWKGLEALQYDVEEMPRNCSASSSCGHCPHGCAYGRKQDATATYLADATKHGAIILTDAFTHSILTQSDAKSQDKRVAKGVSLHIVDNSGLKVKILAPIVVASCGSLHTPALLLRSGLTCKGNVGKNLHLHCATAIAAEFPHLNKDEDETEGQIKVWEGPQMSTYSREAAKWGSSGYGPLVSMTAAHPGLLAVGCGWDGVLPFRRNISRMPWIAAGCVYVRDQDSGYVTLDANGGPSVNYWPSPRDRESILSGLEVAVQALAVAGARRIISNYHGMTFKELELDRLQDGSILHPERIEEFIQSMKSAGLQRTKDTLFSLHQMGSCRMGDSDATSVVDGSGQCWECKGLYIADASVFPTASGVNPMITTYAIAHMISRGIAKEKLHKVF